MCILSRGKRRLISLAQIIAHVPSNAAAPRPNRVRSIVASWISQRIPPYYSRRSLNHGGMLNIRVVHNSQKIDMPRAYQLYVTALLLLHPRCVPALFTRVSMIGVSAGFFLIGALITTIRIISDNWMTPIEHIWSERDVAGGIVEKYDSTWYTPRMYARARFCMCVCLCMRVFARALVLAKRRAEIGLPIIKREIRSNRGGRERLLSHLFVSAHPYRNVSAR